MQRKPIIGLTGGIGAGKSTVAGLFAEAGAAVIDADALNAAELREPEVLATLSAWWGPCVVRDGIVDRKHLAEIVFADATARTRLEQLLHPRIAAARDREIARYLEDTRVNAIVLDAPLLLEVGLHRMCDLVVFIDADPAVRFQRVHATRGWSEREWQQRENAQLPLDKKRAQADDIVVNNSTDLDALRTSIEEILEQLAKQ